MGRDASRQARRTGLRGGPHGAGETTLINAIAGLHRVKGGFIPRARVNCKASMAQVLEVFPALKVKLESPAGSLAGGTAADGGDWPRPDGAARPAAARRAFPGPGSLDRDGHVLHHPPGQCAGHLGVVGGAERGHGHGTGQPGVCGGGVIRAGRDNRHFDMSMSPRVHPAGSSCL